MINMMPTSVPDDFRAVFIAHGWRGIERHFGARTSLMMEWINQCGGIEVLQAERRAYRQARMEAAAAKVRMV